MVALLLRSYSFFYIQSDYLPDQQTSRACRGYKDDVGMQGRKHRSCKLRAKKQEKKDINCNILKEQKTFYRKVVHQQVFEIMTRIRVADLTPILHVIPYVLDDS
ncbi:hypothetical protein TNCV_2548601 [Trichonephila clavipes]|nr:hypothetical protein TNCV_2548601 [Trichonephila clavipes]